MKKNLLSLMLVFIAMLVSPFCANAQDIPDDDGEEIVVYPSHQTTETGPKRNPPTIPIAAFYYSTVSCLEVVFLSNVGDVTICLTNQTTGNNCYSQVNSNLSNVFIPINLGIGTYCIEFETQEGITYTGLFTVY